jgi:hypothetical protein
MASNSLTNDPVDSACTAESVHLQQVTDGKELASASKLKQIQAAMDDPDFPLPKLRRLLMAEIFSLLVSMRKLQANGPCVFENRLQTQALHDQLKSFLDLNKQLMAEQVMAKHERINFDGPKFAYVHGQLIEIAKDSLRDIGFDDHTIRSFVMHYAEKVGEHDARIRRETEAIGSKM